MLDVPRELVQDAGALETGDADRCADDPSQDEHGKAAQPVALPTRDRRAAQLRERDREAPVAPAEVETIGVRIEAAGPDVVTTAPEDGIAPPGRKQRGRRGRAASLGRSRGCHQWLIVPST